MSTIRPVSPSPYALPRPSATSTLEQLSNPTLAAERAAAAELAQLEYAWRTTAEAAHQAEIVYRAALDEMDAADHRAREAYLALERGKRQLASKLPAPPAIPRAESVLCERAASGFCVCDGTGRHS